MSSTKSTKPSPSPKLRRPRRIILEGTTPEGDAVSVEVNEMFMVLYDNRAIIQHLLKAHPLTISCGDMVSVTFP